MSAAQQFVAMFTKEFALEWRNRRRSTQAIFFGALALLLFAFAGGPDVKSLTRLAPGFLWLALLFSSVSGLAQSMRVEFEGGAIDALLLARVRMSVLFAAKAAANAVLLVGLGVVMLPGLVVLYDASFALGVVSLLGILVLGAAAISAPGTIVASIAVRTQGQDLLLPLLLFPLLVPSLLGAVKATSLVMLGDPMGHLGGWVQLLIGFNLVYWPLGGVMFSRTIEE